MCISSITLIDFYLHYLGLPKSVMTTALDDLFIILMSWSDNRGLAHEIAKTGFVQVFTGFLTTGLYLSSIIPVS